MRRIGSIFFVALAASGVLFARGGMRPLQRTVPADEVQQPAAQPAEPQETTATETKIIHVKSDNNGPIAPGDSTIFMVGNVAAQQNGAVITCDSAVLYTDDRLECFGNVLINKNTTYIYGDRAEYDGTTNMARVFSPIVKVVDGDATLYTYSFSFNTLDNIGQFGGGGVLINRENRLESVRGYYYADFERLVAVDSVEMRNDEYELRGDSVVYDMATDDAWFFDRTNIWNRDGDYLYADRGSYHKADTLYKVTLNGYVLTDKQEIWSDSIDYYRAEDHVVLRHDLQLDDTEHKVLAFGDYGEYWKEPGNALLTRRPAVVSYDLSQGDTLFMRSDTMYLYTLRVGQLPGQLPSRADSVARADTVAAAATDSTQVNRTDSLSPTGRSAADSLASRRGEKGRPTRPDSLVRGAVDALGRPAAPDSLRTDSLAHASVDSLGRRMAADTLLRDSLVRDSLARIAADTLTDAERKALRREELRKQKEARKAEEARERKIRLDSIAAKRRAKTNARLLAEKEREEARLNERRKKAAARLDARRARAARKGKKFTADSTELHVLDSLLGVNERLGESLAARTDSLAQDSLARDSLARDSLDSLAADSLATPADSLYRLIQGYRNVRIYRSDFQSVCDSIVAISSDSTIHLYIDPVLWNEVNQITADVIDVFTANEQLVRAECIGSPMMVGRIDTLHYNQIAGKEMTAYFRDNEIYRNDVNGNVQTIYYTEDGQPPEVTMMSVITSGDASFYIEDKQVVTIVYRNSITGNYYPIDKIPPTQSLFLEGFKWEGDRRPAQRDVFDRTIRPSQRAERTALPHPEFPILQRIDRHKAQLIEEGLWGDRMDQVDAETVEWMRELGFEVGQPRASQPEL